jgi:hypothetical protein
MSRRFTAIAVTLPLLAIALGIVRAELTRRSAPRFVLEIGGFDPRDLLRGRYLQFTLRAEPCDDEPARCCVCLGRAAAGSVSRVERTACDAAQATCDGWLPPEAVDRRYRFYVPEDRAADLDRQLREAAARRTARAVVTVAGGKIAQVLDLLLDGEPVAGRAD